MLTVHVANILQMPSGKSLLCQWEGLVCVKIKIDVGIVGAPCMWSAFHNDHRGRTFSANGKALFVLSSKSVL